VTTHGAHHKSKGRERKPLPPFRYSGMIASIGKRITIWVEAVSNNQFSYDISFRHEGSILLMKVRENSRNNSNTAEKGKETFYSSVNIKYIYLYQLQPSFQQVSGKVI
jgi:hypothetical protein